MATKQFLLFGVFFTLGVILSTTQAQNGTSTTTASPSTTHEPNVTECGQYQDFKTCCSNTTCGWCSNSTGSMTCDILSDSCNTSECDGLSTVPPPVATTENSTSAPGKVSTGSISSHSDATVITTPSFTDTTQAPTPAPCPKGGFDAASFVGGMVLAAGVIGIILVAVRFYCKKSEDRYQQF